MTFNLRVVGSSPTSGTVFAEAMEISNIWELIGILILIGGVVVILGLAAFMCWFNSKYRRHDSDENYADIAEMEEQN